MVPNPKDDQHEVPTIGMSIKDPRVSSYEKQRTERAKLPRRPVLASARKVTIPDAMVSDQPQNKTARGPRSHKCTPEQFACKGRDEGRCMSLKNLCDGVPKCADGYDEMGCPNHPERMLRNINAFDVKKFDTPRIAFRPRARAFERGPVYHKYESSTPPRWEAVAKKEKGQDMSCRCTCTPAL